MEPLHLAPAVVLVRPQEEGNLGATARAMANMGLSTLRVVEPAAPVGNLARAMAMGGQGVLEGIRRASSVEEALGPFRRVIGTTSGRGRELGTPILAPRDLPVFLAQDPPGTPTALLFGPEVGGLTNDELALCNALVTIPGAPEHPTLNLAQAVLIVAYELYLAREGGSEPQGTSEPPATREELEGFLHHLAQVLVQAGFQRDDTFPTVFRDLRALTARAAPTSREIKILRGICRRLLWRLERGPEGENASSVTDQ